MAGDKKHIDEISGTETTGHEWDGIKELNTPLPRWWLFLFFACIVWAIGYWILMPSWPLLHGYTHGLLNHSQRDDVTANIKALNEARAAREHELTGATLEISRPIRTCCNSPSRKASRHSATIAHRVTVQVARAGTDIPISMTMCGFGAGRWRISSIRSRSECARPALTRASRRCRPSVATASCRPGRSTI